MAHRCRTDEIHFLEGDVVASPAELWEEVFEEAAPAAAPARINRLALDQRLRQSLVQSWSRCPWQMQPLRAEEVQELEVELASGPEL